MAIDIDPDFVPEFLTRPDPTPEQIAAMHAANRASREAVLAARRAAVIDAARDRARASLRDRRWAWARPELVEEAEALLARDNLTDGAVARLAALVANADAIVRRASASTSAPVASELGLARIPAVRAAAAEALEFMTRLDGDMASLRNQAGWSKTTAVLGHVLTAAGDLDEAQASHALRILRRHRRQLPAPLAACLFEGAIV